MTLQADDDTIQLHNTHTQYTYTTLRKEGASVVIAIANQKGGIGKTTTACALAAILQQRGKNVLLIDSDPQCNSTDTSRAVVEGVETLYDLLIEEGTDVRSCIQHTAPYDVIAGDGLLRDADKLLSGVDGAYRLRERLEAIRSDYDVVVVDTPPGLGVLLTGALTAADEVIIPVTADRYALQGMSQLTKTIRDVQRYTNKDLHITGLLVTRRTGKTTLSTEIIDGLPSFASELGCDVLSTSIRNTVKVQEAQAARSSVIEWAPDCTAAQDYVALVDELTAKGVL